MFFEFQFLIYILDTRISRSILCKISGDLLLRDSTDP